jgi:23S rRNA (guanosine2251-2'-O)-methyltransferase
MVRDRTTDDGLVVPGANAVLEAFRAEEPVRRLCLGRPPREAELRAAAAGRGIRVETLARAELDRLAGTPHHQGAVAVLPGFRYQPLESVTSAECSSALVLDGVQDPRNLGAILRTARAAGVGGVVLPRDRSVGVTPVVVAASAGLLFGLRIARVPNLVRAMEGLKGAGYWLVALLPQGGESLYDRTPPTRPALVVGGEGGGLRPLVRRTCDFTVSIPMAQGVESLNVAVAVAVALYDLVVRPRVHAGGE